MDVGRVQRRTLTLLVGTQMVGGVGVVIGISVGALLFAAMGGTKMSGLASSAGVVGAALLAVPATRLTRAHGRRRGLAFAYGVGAIGSAVLVTGAALHSMPLVFVGATLFGGGSTANLQARYAAVDLAEPDKRGRQLSLVVWATTVGGVAGPNLAPLADQAMRRFGTVEYAGPFVFSTLAFALAAAAIAAFMRPDPLLLARQIADESSGGPGTAVAEQAKGAGLGVASRAVLASPAARLGVASVATGHLVMVGVMSMTPLHIRSYQSSHGDVLRVVGIVLSLHVLGMFALSPVVGWLTDRVGRRAVILGGIAVLLAACAIAGLAGHSTPLLSVGLVLLGLGWSATMVAGSTLLSESVPAAVRPSVQGLSDLIMGLSGALAGALSGVVVALAGYPTLTVLSAVAIVPLLALALRRGTMAITPIPSEGA